MPELDDLLGGRYRVLEILEGGMGQILVCDWLSSEAPSDSSPSRVALKTFKRKYFFDNSVRLSFVREASTWLRLADVPHVMPVISIDIIDDQPFIVMPAAMPGLLGERSIADLLDYGQIDPSVALSYAFQVGYALTQASGRISGLVHGDIKPANVLLVAGRAFVSDFGLVSAMALGQPDVRLEGTWLYRAPELWGEVANPVSASGDIYAFGAMLFEMLSGHAPIAANGDRREDWAAAHADETPRIPDGFSEMGLPAASMALALKCLNKDPSQRPSDFSSIMAGIRSIYEEFAPADLLLLMIQIRDLGVVLLEQATEMLRLRVTSLIALEEFTQALDELDAIPPEQYDSRLWVARGTTLSLLNRAEEALDAFNLGLNDQLGEQEHIGALIEYSLALKRLHRFAEARELLEDLIPEVPDDQVATVVVNLATVHLEQHEGEKVVGLLEPFVRRAPGNPEAWANLGLGYSLLGRYDDAVAAFGRSLALAPQNGLVRVALAAVYMDQLGRLDEAWAALDQAFDSGHESREWFVRMFAASMLLDRRDSLQGMLFAAKKNMPAELGEQLIAESIELANRLADRYGSEPQDEEREQEYRDDIAQPSIGPGIDQPASLLLDDSAPSSNVPVAKENLATVPFLNFRFYEFLDYTIDYYERPDVPNYLEDLGREIRRAHRDPRFADVGGLRGSPFLFTKCPHCGIDVLTNRDAGRSIACRICGMSFAAMPSRDPHLQSILREFSAELRAGVIEDSHDSDVHVLFVQSAETSTTDTIGEVCRTAGMSDLGNRRLMSVYMFRLATTRGIAKLDRAWSVWTLPRTIPDSRGGEGTPRDLVPIIRELSEKVPAIVTVSTTLTAEEMASMNETIDEVDVAAEHSLRAAIRSGEAQAAELRQLASLLERRADYRESERVARAAVGMDDSSAEGWEILGRALLKQEAYGDARDALEMASSLDPTLVLALMMLATCYERLQDDVRAREVWTRAATLTGGEFLK